MPSNGTAFCLDDVAQKTNMVPAEYLPDGKVLMVSKDREWHSHRWGNC
ncbi:hypothetical protein [Actinomyces trachealis]|nr:hypothetical protein [Actinomyces trachealis]